MNESIDRIKTLDIIERMKLAKIGTYKKWQLLIKKIKNHENLNQSDLEYFTSITRIYKDSSITIRSKIYHTKLSQYDEKPLCEICGEDSTYYCNVNDQYFCMIHVVGHDENEF
jgi:hypothetical protein